MKVTLFFCCALALLTTGNGLSQDASNPPGPTQTTGASAPVYHTFQPSKIEKRKRKLEPGVTARGWKVLALTLGVVGGMALLAVWLWPMASTGWRVLIALAGSFLAMVVIGLGMYFFSLAYPTDDDVYAEARKNMYQLGEKLSFTLEDDWCFPGDYYHISVGANQDGLLVVDYRQDKGWLIPKQNIANVKSDFVATDAAETTYPTTSDTEAIIEQEQSYYTEKLREEPMQVLQFELRDLPLRQLNLVYQGKMINIYPDITKNITDDLRILWDPECCPGYIKSPPKQDSRIIF